MVFKDDWISLCRLDISLCASTIELTPNPANIKEPPSVNGASTTPKIVSNIPFLRCD
ncbi:Uncharacterised protein [Vibrio cholerae]|nr:Uncharacterised protein [Vibrio cholerae]